MLYAQQQLQEIVKIEQEKNVSLLKGSDTQYPGDQTYDVKYYKLDLILSTQPNNLTGRVSVNLNPVIPIESLFLDLTNALTIDSVLVNNIPANYTTGSGKINITLNRVYNTNETITVLVIYHGIPSSSGFGSFSFGNHNGTPAIFTLSEPYGSSDWFPCKDTPADKADSADIWITCAQEFYAVSNGKLIAEINNGNGTKTFKWKESYPIAQYLISLAITDYTIQNLWFRYSPTDSMPVINYVYPELYTPANIQTLNKTPWFLKVFSDAFGLYPFITEKYGQANFGWGGGMEHQTVSSVGDFGEGLLVHELAHQWFGDKITCRDWHHIWLNEGFATWCSAFYYGQTYGQDSYDVFILNNMNNAKTAQGTIYVQDISSVNEIFNGARSYAKGAIVLHMLRGVLGDTLFFKTMRDYINHPQYAYGTAVTEDFKGVAESVSGMDLTYFFNEWIYGEKYPKYSVSWNYSLLSGNQYNITLNIAQALGNNPSYFKMPVQIKVSTTLGDTLINIFNDQQSQQFTFLVNGTPTDLVFDPGNYILKDINITNVPDDLHPKVYDLKQNYPNPFNPSTRIIYRVPERSFIMIKIYDFLGKEVETLVNEEKEAGNYFIQFNANDNYSSGVYFYKLTSGTVSLSRKMMILK